MTVPDDSPPSLQCPQSFVIELVDQEDSYDIDFRKLRGQVNATDGDGSFPSDVAVTFIPERATIRTGAFENVTVVASDKAGNLARCFFQVAIRPTHCVDWELEAPANGDISCERGSSVSGGGLQCEATCRAGFRFTDGERSKSFSCSESSPWTPARVVPDCVSEDTTLSTYDVEATISYRASGAPVPDYCPDVYAQTVQRFQAAIGQTLSDKCTDGAGNVDIQVRGVIFKKGFSNKIIIGKKDKFRMKLVHDTVLYTVTVCAVCAQSKRKLALVLYTFHLC